MKLKSVLGRRFFFWNFWKIVAVVLVLFFVHYTLKDDFENLIYHAKHGAKFAEDQDNVTNLTKQKFENYCAQPISEQQVVTSVISGTQTCRIPQLNPFHPHAMKLVEDLKEPLRCKTKQRATLSGGLLNIDGTDVDHASYRYIIRPPQSDFRYRKSNPIPINSWQEFPVSEEYIELTLALKNGEVLREYLMQVVRREEIVSRPSTKTELDLNILIIGIDSISNGHAQRKLPKSYNYIRNVLGGYVFMGHSVVGDGTTEQVAAFLTGKGEQEYAESRRGEPNAKPVDDWNWIFKKAKEHGYVTSYCEDSPYIGTFQYRLLGFRDPPTDYYPRAFFLAADKEGYSKLSPHCYGSEKIYNYHLDMARKLYEQYPKRKKFIFHFPGEISHNNFNAVQLLDEDLNKFLKEFHTKGYLDDTLLILLGDHGWRYGDFRQTVQGKLEERLPLFSMTFPKWFKQKYPTLANNLRTNTQRLTSWFDVYATFNHLLTYPKEPQRFDHGTSLLNEVPLERSCTDASIPEHWCPCVQWSDVDHKHEHLKYAALTAINHINNLNFQEPLAVEKCSKLSLLEMKNAMIETPTRKVLRFRRSGKDGYVPQFSHDIRPKDHCNYQITFVTFPNHGVFEASVHFESGRFFVKGSISRINKYGDQPKCIADTFPHLRKYCYCK